MKNSQDIFVPYLVAKELKNVLNFNEPCICSYNKEQKYNLGSTFGITNALIDDPEFQKNGYDCVAPTYDQVIQWFSDNGFEINCLSNFHSENREKFYFYCIDEFKDNIFVRELFNSIDKKRKIIFKTRRLAMNAAFVRAMELYSKRQSVIEIENAK